MNSLFSAALEIQTFMQGCGWRFCFIGNLAVVRWGEVRATQDVDVCVFTGFGDEDAYIQSLLGHFKARIRGAGAFARRNRALLLLASNKVSIDVSLGSIPFEEAAVERATPFEFARKTALVTCSAEDLVVFKAFADRPRDWLDVEGILVRQRGAIDWEYTMSQLAVLARAREDRSILDKLAALRDQVAAAR